VNHEDLELRPATSGTKTASAPIRLYGRCCEPSWFDVHFSDIFYL